MKLSKKVAHLALKKVVSIIIIAGIAISLTACPADTVESGSQIDDRIEASTRTTETNPTASFSEPQQSIADTTATTPSETTTEATEPEPTYNITDVEGEYVYTIYQGTEYETTLKMSSSVEFFLRDPDGYCGGSTYWRIQEFADYHNWLEDGKYTLEDIENDNRDDIGTYTIGYSNIYMIPCGDYRCYLEINYYDAPESESWKGQIKSITVRYIQNDSMEPAFANPIPEQMDVVINFGEHPENYGYQCDYKKFGGSFEDIVVLQYVFCTVSENPGDSSVLFGYFKNPALQDGQWIINLP